MKKQIIGIVCVAAMMSSCHIYKSYDRPETIDASIGCDRYNEYGKPALAGSVPRCQAAGVD